MTEIDPRWARAIRAHADQASPTPEAWAVITERAAGEPVDPVRGGVTRAGGARRVWLAAAAVLVVLVVGAVARAGGGEDDDAGPVTAGPDDTTTTTTPAEPLVEGITMVLADDDHGPWICTATDSGLDAGFGPPTCDEGIPIEGWDWDAVEDTTTEGTTWGHFHLTGRFVDDRFVLTEGRDPEPGETGLGAVDPYDDPDRFATPCPEPPGGWVTRDPARTTEDHKRSLLMFARAQPDLGEIWVDEEPGVPGAVSVMVASFTGDLDRHRQDLESIWGGPICVTEAPLSAADLRDAARELEATEGGLDPIGTVPSFNHVMDDAIGGRLIVSVIAAPPHADDAMAERFGVPVIVDRTFTPVE